MLEDQLEPLVEQESQVLPDLQESLVLQVLQALLEAQGQLEELGLQEAKEIQVKQE